MRAKDRTGLIGEEQAAEFLRSHGHRVLERRWRTSTGELDLITRDGDELVAVEVKARRGTGFGHPLEAVNAQKLHRLHRLLAEYAATQESWPAERRVDVIGVLLGPHRGRGTESVIEHLKDL